MSSLPMVKRHIRQASMSIGNSFWLCKHDCYEWQTMTLCGYLVDLSAVFVCKWSFPGVKMAKWGLVRLVIEVCN